MDKGVVYFEMNNYWECEECCTQITKGKEWEELKICPICNKEIWIYDESQMNNFSRLY